MEEDGTTWYGDGAPGSQPVMQDGPPDMHLKDEAPIEGSLDAHTPMDAADSSALTAIDVEAHVTNGQQAEGQQGVLLPLEEVDGFFTTLDSSGREHRPRYYGHAHTPNAGHALQQYPHNAHGEYPECMSDPTPRVLAACRPRPSEPRNTNPNTQSLVSRFGTHQIKNTHVTHKKRKHSRPRAQMHTFRPTKAGVITRPS